MKLYSTTRQETKKGFTLIEMIGVLAVIAILAAVLIPKVFEAINNSRVNNAAMSCQTVKTAIADHYAKFGGLAINGTQTPPGVIDLTTDYANYDAILVSEGFLDKPFAVKISDAAGVDVQLRPTVAATVGPDGANAAFNLDGAGTVNDATGSAVVVAVIPGVTANDAIDLNSRIDGISLAGDTGTDTANPLTSDFRGRVKYAAPVNGTTTVHVYLTHR